MAQVLVGNEGDLNSTTNVTAVASPAGTDQRIVQYVGGRNVDTVVHGFVASHLKGATEKEIGKVTGIAAGAQWMVIGPGSACFSAILDATNESIVIKMTEAMTTTQPTFNSVALNNA